MAFTIHSFTLLALLLSASLVKPNLGAPLRTSNISRIEECDNSTYTLPPNSTASAISFSSCPPELGFPSSIQCAEFSVPINWDEPYGAHFNLGVVKLPAQGNSTSKIGSLFMNPGGPGGAASALIAQIQRVLDAPDLFNAFDLIGLDPRGVGLSHQVECDESIFAEPVSLFPKTQEDYDRLVNKNKRFGQSCLDKTGPLLQYVDTINAAKDHEAVRIALGNEPFNMIGESYGSQIGASYAELFPNNIRALVFDGIIQHSLPEPSSQLVESTSYNLVFTRFLNWASTDDSSPLKGHDVGKLWLELLKNASTTPIPALQCSGVEDRTCATSVTDEDILFNAQESLNFAPEPKSKVATWGALASALLNASQGDASALSNRYDFTSYNVSVSERAIGCLDWTHDTSLNLQHVLAKKRMVDTYAPLTQGGSQTWRIQHACVGWPFKATNPPRKLDVNTPNPILMVTSEGDPSTGYAWAVGMLEEIRNRILVTRNGVGHTSLVLNGEASKIIQDFVISGGKKAPAHGIVVDT